MDGYQLTAGLRRSSELGCHSAQGDHSFKDVRLASRTAELAHRRKEINPIGLSSFDAGGTAAKETAGSKGTVGSGDAVATSNFGEGDGAGGKGKVGIDDGFG